MSKLLIIRFSSLGDVAMTLPVVWSLATQHPELDITVLSRDVFAPLFSRVPKNVHFCGVDLKDKHRGLLGLHRFYTDVLKPLKFDFVADLHWVLRSMLFDCRLKWEGAKIAHIEKGHVAKKRLTRATHKVMEPQLLTVERYRNTLLKLGFDFSLNFTSIFGIQKGDLTAIATFVSPKETGETWIGIAPFAKHNGKVYPLEQMEKVAACFASRSRTKVFLFGAGPEETLILEQWKSTTPQAIYVVAGKLKMDTELILMSHLDAMVTMDSANMHFASLVNLPVVSVWGATHPYCGFLGYGQKAENCVQLDLSCRPCSVFGNKPCFRKDYACMTQLPPEQIIQKVEKVISRKAD